MVAGRDLLDHRADAAVKLVGQVEPSAQAMIIIRMPWNTLVQPTPITPLYAT